jgi:transcriptional regulator with XRE-family HTH domain
MALMQSGGAGLSPHKTLIAQELGGSSMAVDFKQIGQRLRAYRMGANLTPEQVADRLGISRAALYKYEKGGVIKLETLERLSKLLGASTTSLLGSGVEYFANAVSFLERMRQLEAESDQVITYFESFSLLLTTPNYTKLLRQMLLEGLPSGFEDRERALSEIERVIAILEERRGEFKRHHPSVLSLVGATQIRRLLRAGLIGTYRLSAAEQEKRREQARTQVESMISLMEHEPIGVQTGVVEDTLPNQSFQILRQRNTTIVAVSPFRLGELPNIRLGVASITAAEEPAMLYQAVANELWRRAHRGPRGADFLRTILAESVPALRSAPVRKRKS